LQIQVFPDLLNGDPKLHNPKAITWLKEFRF